MEDKTIIGLFFQRDERALELVRNKYGRFIYGQAYNITSSHEDAEELENDTYMKLWNSIPPENPVYFMAYIGKIVRNAALSLYRKNTAAKRMNGITLQLSELQDCIPSAASAEDEFNLNYTSSVISDWLRTLSAEERNIFIRRYWYGSEVGSLAKETGISPQKISALLFSLRKKLKAELESKGVTV